MAQSILSNNFLHFTSDGTTTVVKATATANKLTFAGASGAMTLDGVADPISDNHAANKSYVDAIAQSSINAALTGLDLKDSVRAASTSDISSTGGGATLNIGIDAGDTLDGITLNENDRILLKNQSNAHENGIFIVGSSGNGSVRSTDFPHDHNENAAGVFTFVEEGSVHAHHGFVIASNSILASSIYRWTQFNATQTFSGDNMVTVSGTTVKLDSSIISHSGGTISIGANTTQKDVHLVHTDSTLKVGGGNTLITSSNVSADTVTSTSDERLKTDIVEITDAVEKVKKLKGVHFSWKESGAADAGVIAQDVEQVCPHWVKENDKGIKSVDYSKLSSLLIQVVKEQQSDIDDLKAAVAALQSA